ncbi:MAG: two-component regulator propeller domain-containing protein [Anaeromyxobacter sp.]
MRRVPPFEDARPGPGHLLRFLARRRGCARRAPRACGLPRLAASGTRGHAPGSPPQRRPRPADLRLPRPRGRRRARSPPSRSPQLAHDAFGEADGLPPGSLQSFTQTPDGILWFASDEGIVRYDGDRFEVLDRTRLPGLPSDLVTGVRAVGSTLWVGTEAGPARIERGVVVPLPPGGPDTGGRTPFVEPDGTAWFPSSQGVHRLQGTTWRRFNMQDGLPDDRITSIEGDGAGTLWVATAGGLARREGERFVPGPAPLDRLPIYRLQTGRSGALHVGTITAGLARLLGGKLTWWGPDQGLPALVAGVAEDRDGALWFGTPTGLYRSANGQLERYGRAQGLPDDRIWDVREDAEGSIWVGPQSGGLHRLRAADVVTVGPPEGLPLDSVSAVVADREGGIWVATGEGLARVAGGRAVPVADPRLRRADVVAALCDQAGALWFGTTHGEVARLRGGQVTWWRGPGAPAAPVRAIEQDGTGRIRIGTELGLAWLEGDRLVTAGPAQGVPADMSVELLARDTGGALLVASSTLGVLRFDGARLAPLPGGPPPRLGVNAMLADPDGTLWLATLGGGLWRLRDGRARALTQAEGLPHDAPWTLLDDRHGNIWTSSNRGIARLSRADLEGVLAGKRPRLAAERLGRAAGMRSAETNAGAPGGAVDRAGRLWFATVKGVASVDPARPRTGAAPPSTQVFEVVVDGRRMAVDGPLALPAGVRRLELHFRPQTLLPDDGRAHRFQLVGFDTAPVETPFRSAAYTHLPHGAYTFQVESRARDGAWGPVGRLRVDVAPFPWETLPFQLGAALTALLFLGGVIAWRIRYHRAREAELQARVEDALAQVRTLRGLLPVCAWCRKVRTDGGYWQKLESYVQAHTHAKFSHAMCPECYQREMGEHPDRKPDEEAG